MSHTEAKATGCQLCELTDSLSDAAYNAHLDGHDLGRVRELAMAVLDATDGASNAHVTPALASLRREWAGREPSDIIRHLLENQLRAELEQDPAARVRAKRNAERAVVAVCDKYGGDFIHRSRSRATTAERIPDTSGLGGPRRKP